jgi:hypothetical protein
MPQAEREKGREASSIDAFSYHILRTQARCR